MYKNEEYLRYCGDGNFAGVYTCIKNKVDLEQKDKSCCDFTGLMDAS